MTVSIIYDCYRDYYVMSLADVLRQSVDHIATERQASHTDGCKKLSNLATPGWRGYSRIYSRQYHTGQC